MIEFKRGLGGAGRIWIGLIPVALTTSQILLGQGSTPALNAGQVTFTKDIAPVLQRSCQNCHRAGQIGPMSLLTYQDVRPWARAIKAQVAKREMPPWYIDRAIGICDFKNDPSLSDQEIAHMGRWVDAGA